MGALSAERTHPHLQMVFQHCELARLVAWMGLGVEWVVTRGPLPLLLRAAQCQARHHIQQGQN